MGPAADTGPSIPDVKVPSIGTAAGQAVDANIASLPKLLAAYQQYGPGYAKSINDIFGQEQKRLQELYPDQAGVQQGLGRNITANLNFIGDAGNSGIPAPLQERFQNLIRSGQAARGVAESPASALSEAQALGEVGEQFRSGVTNEAIQFLGLSPMTTPGSIQNLDTLGLTPISSTDLLSGNLDLTQMDIDNQYTQYALKLRQFEYEQAQKKRQAALLGTFAGPWASGIYGAKEGIGGGEGFGQGFEGGINLASRLASIYSSVRGIGSGPTTSYNVGGSTGTRL